MDKIVCIGKNYLDHVKELGDLVPQKPVIFIKPPSVLRMVENTEELNLKIPANRGALHYEAELVLRMSCDAHKIDEKEAETAFDAVTLGLDMTLRDEQVEQKRLGHPWTTSKVFPDCAIIGPWLSLRAFPNYLEENFTFSLAGELRQSGFGKNMRLGPAACIAYISKYFQLVAGDLVFTGTPAGVGSVALGQRGTLKYGSIGYSVIWNQFC